MGVNGLFLAITAVIVGGFGLLLRTSPAVYGFLLMEDTPLEWLEFFSIVAAGLAFWEAAVSRARARARLGACAAVLLALFTLFVAGEEISWGQRVLGFSPPGFFMYRNVQQETTIHNLAVPWLRPRTIATVFIVCYGIFLPLAGRWAVFRRLRLPEPPWGAIPAFALTPWLFTLPITGTDDEIGELLFAIAMLASGLRAAGHLGRAGGKYAAQLVTILLLLSCLASWATFQSPEQREHLVRVGPLQAGQAFEGIGRPRDAATQYEKLARYWGSDWALWNKVVTLYRDAADYAKAYALAGELVRVHRREPLLYQVLLDLGDSLGIPEDALARIEEEYQAVRDNPPSTPDDYQDQAFLVELWRSLGDTTRAVGH